MARTRERFHSRRNEHFPSLPVVSVTWCVSKWKVGTLQSFSALAVVPSPSFTVGLFAAGAPLVFARSHLSYFPFAHGTSSFFVVVNVQIFNVLHKRTFRLIGRAVDSSLQPPPPFFYLPSSFGTHSSVCVWVLSAPVSLLSPRLRRLYALHETSCVLLAW